MECIPQDCPLSRFVFFCCFLFSLVSVFGEFPGYFPLNVTLVTRHVLVHLMMRCFQVYFLVLMVSASSFPLPSWLVVKCASGFHIMVVPNCLK